MIEWLADDVNSYVDTVNASRKEFIEARTKEAFNAVKENKTL